MLKKSTLPFLLGIFVLSVYSCKKEGVGGESTIKGIVKHHDSVITNAIVYIKYGAREFPGGNTSDYDSYVTSDGFGNYSFTDLVKGDYYLYGYGYDKAVMKDVKGGVYVYAKKNKVVEMNVPVSE